jgi:acyl-CoA synthetase (AMP-forming)/AMP-acid ligase II
MSSTVVELLGESCDRWPDRTLLAFEDGLELTRRDVRGLVERFAAVLSGVVAPGERVAICTENRAEYLIAFLAVLAVVSIKEKPLSTLTGDERRAREAAPPATSDRSR